MHCFWVILFQFQSHQIFHMFVLAGAFVHLHGSSVIASHRLSFGEECDELIGWRTSCSTHYCLDCRIEHSFCIYSMHVVLSFTGFTIKSAARVDVFRDGSDLHSVICLLYRVHQISTPPHDLLLLTQQRFKIILKYFMWLLVTVFCLSVAIIVQ